MDEQTPNPLNSVPSFKGQLNLGEAVKSIKSGAKWGILFAALSTFGLSVLESIYANLDKILGDGLPDIVRSTLILTIGLVTTYFRSKVVATKLADQGQEPPLEFISSFDTTGGD